ncbi:MAG: electron transfer flavoprotein subunit beta/FixA family protein [Planctomycetes bacterium]|nr:electron transfer flavoprotein subunit beta/FixA family protein [Planctomycetota bacterium]MBM4087442.1 electron transfer flavoprotein subunit beta/FixA family protein [Planctomycetota bacterium]
MPYTMIVSAKQVPDTKNITGQAMKEDGTVNRGALPAIFNPEDLNALEAAVDIKDKFGGTVTVITMGPPAASELLREALYRGADRVVLLTDRRFAASDTLATSYALSMAVRKLGHFDIVFCGRQAIDGDTAQIGPQLAEKLDVSQFTYVEQILKLDGKNIQVRRSIEGGYEVVEGVLPALLTITGTANTPRPPSVKRLAKFKKARSLVELQKQQNYEAPNVIEDLKARGLLIEEWNADDMGCDPAWCGGSGSPTKVKKIEAVKVAATEHRRIEAAQEPLTQFVKELIADHTVG